MADYANPGNDKDVNAYLKKLDELHTQARSARRLLEPQWFLNLAFFQGEQWLAWAGRNLHKPELAPNRVTVVENRIAGCVRTELSKMTKNRPVFTVTPNTGDEADTNASELGERVMRHMWKHLKLHELALKALEWSRICGAGFMKCYWDSTIGPPVQVLVAGGQVQTHPQTGEVLKGEMAQQMAPLLQAQGVQAQLQTLRSGDIRAEVRSPFQMFVDPICDSFEDAEWLIEESVKSKDYCVQRYGAKAQNLKADTPANPGLVEGRLMGNANVAGTSYKGVKIREYWCKPCPQYPKGCRTVWAQGQILLHDEAPFDPMPYVMFTGIPVPGRLWPMSVVEMLRGPQTELNKVRSQMAENRNRLGNPTLLANKQAVPDPEVFLDSVSQPGGVIFYDSVYGPDAVPKYLEAPSLPPYIPQEVELIGAAIEDISGQHEVTNANVPPGVTAASAITLLQEADDTRLGLAMQDYEENLGRFGRKVLKLVSNFYTDSRTMRIGGDDGAWQIQDFKGSDMRGNIHVEVQAGSAFPQSKAAKQAAIQDVMTFLVQSGNAPHGRQLAQFLRDAGIGAYDTLVDEYTRDEMQANRENVLLMQGMQMPTNIFDNDQAHIDNHEDYEKSAAFAAAPPPVQQVHLQHTAEHRMKLAQQQQQEMALQQQMSGQAPSPAQQGSEQLSLMQQGTQADQQNQAASQQQGYQAAQAEQQQRQSEEKHGAGQLSVAQQNRMALEKHHQDMQHREELHQAKLEQIKRQGAQRNDGRDNGPGRRAA